MHIHVTIPGGERPRTFELKGSLGWTVYQLAQAGAQGVTPIERPAPRWSAYVHDLRRMGLPIETELAAHKGRYPGQHARYVLACDITLTLLDRNVA